MHYYSKWGFDGEVEHRAFPIPHIFGMHILNREKLLM